MSDDKDFEMLGKVVYIRSILSNAMRQNDKIGQRDLKELKNNSIELFNYFSDKLIEFEDDKTKSEYYKKVGKEPSR